MERKQYLTFKIVQEDLFSYSFTNKKPRINSLLSFHFNALHTNGPIFNPEFNDVISATRGEPRLCTLNMSPPDPENISSSPTLSIQFLRLSDTLEKMIK